MGFMFHNRMFYNCVSSVAICISRLQDILTKNSIMNAQTTWKLKDEESARLLLERRRKYLQRQRQMDDDDEPWPGEVPTQAPKIVSTVSAERIVEGSERRQNRLPANTVQLIQTVRQEKEKILQKEKSQNDRQIRDAFFEANARAGGPIASTSSGPKNPGLGLKNIGLLTGAIPKQVKPTPAKQGKGRGRPKRMVIPKPSLSTVPENFENMTITVDQKGGQRDEGQQPASRPTVPYASRQTIVGCDEDVMVTIVGDTKIVTIVNRYFLKGFTEDEQNCACLHTYKCMDCRAQEAEAAAAEARHKDKIKSKKANRKVRKREWHRQNKGASGAKHSTDDQ